MKFSLGWIREFVETTGGPGETASRLTARGLAVESFEAAQDDTILEIEVFTNRPDCMNHYGVARELAAALAHPLCPYPGTVSEDGGAEAAGSLASVAIEAGEELCGRYTARIVRGVKVGPSPDWLARRLTTLGMRPVNNVVDATNYVLWEFGQPLHAFDLKTLEGRQIRVRRARRGEALTTLDGMRRTLDPAMLVIADASHAVALAGVMGGIPTMVTDGTTDLLLESAHFSPASVRKTARSLGLSTDASYRFERGADIEAAVPALNRVASLIAEIAGGSVSPGILEARPRSALVPRSISLRTRRVWSLLGLDGAVAGGDGAIGDVLTRLQFVVAGGHCSFTVEVPSHRLDIEREEDLIEEVGRSLGYDAIPERLPLIPGSGGVARRGHRRETAFRGALAAAGVHEASTTPFVSAAADWALRQRLSAEEPAIEPIAIENPIALDQEVLRTTLLPGLMAAVAHNINRGARDVRLFEIGRTFRRGLPPPSPHELRKHPPAPPVEETVSLAMALSGAARPISWLDPAREVTFWDVKGLVASVMAAGGLAPRFSSLPASEALTAGMTARVDVGGEPAGRIGSLSQAARDRFGIKQEVFVAELSLSGLWPLPSEGVSYEPLPRFPAVSRDLSLIIPASREYRDIERTIAGIAPERIASVSLFDRYAGEMLPAGKIGAGVRILFQDPEKTLTSEEVNEVLDRIVAALGRELEATLRDSTGRP